MEDITLERLLNNFSEVLRQIDDIVARKDIVSAREVLKQVGELVSNEEHVQLDDLDGEDYDHILHKLLANISGVIEISEMREINPELDGLVKRREEVQNRINEIDDLLRDDEPVNPNEGNPNQARIEEIQNAIRELEERRQRAVRARGEATTDEEIAIADSDRMDLTRQIGELRQELEGLTRQVKQANPNEENPNQARIEELGRLIESRRKLVEELNKELPKLDRNSEEWVIAFAQRRNLNDEIARYEEELNRLTKEADSVGQEKETRIVEEREILLDGIEMPENIRSLEEQRQYAIREFETRNGIKFDPSIHEVTFYGAEGEQYEDNPITIFRIEKVSKREIPVKIEDENPNQARIEEIQNAIRELEERRQRAVRARSEATTDEEIAIADSDRMDLTRQIGELRQELEGLTRQDEPSNPNQDSKEALRKEKERLIKELSEVDERIKTYRGEKTQVNDRLDLGADASKIGDKIFKTAEIRKELAEREITREEFLAFYASGREALTEELKTIRSETEKIESDMRTIFSDKQSEIDLLTQFNDADNNQEQTTASSSQKAVEIAEKIRQNMIASKIGEDLLQQLELLDNGITEANAKQFITEVRIYYAKKLNALNERKRECDENISILNKEIERIQSEQRSFDGNFENQVIADADNEKKLRERQIRATIFGDNELNTEWNERVERFVSHRISVEPLTYRDENGKIINTGIEYETVEQYEQFKEDASFLNLADYKKYLEISSIYRNSGKDINLMLQILDDKTVAEYRKRESALPGSGDKWLDEYMAEKAEYVSTFHGFTNEHGVKYSNLKTAGSTLKAMKPVKGELPAKTKMENGLYNVARFLGLRKFWEKDENGDIGINAKTFFVDAAVVGGFGVTLATLGPIGAATWGAAYAAKGVVTLGNIIASRVEYGRHGDEIETNLPTLAKPTRHDKEVARRDYYRDIEERGRFSSWAIAKLDKYFTRGRARETEEKIVQNRVKEANAVIDERTRDTIEDINYNRQLSNRNQEARQTNTRNVVLNQDIYNDIVRDPDSLDREQAISEIATIAAIQSQGGTENDFINPTQQPYSEKYQKQAADFKQTTDIDEVKKAEGDTIAVTAITIDEKYKGSQENIDRINKVWTAILTAGIRYGVDRLSSSFATRTNYVQKQKQWIEGTKKEEPVYQDVTRTELDPSKKISELAYDNRGLNDVYGGPKITDADRNGLDIDAIVLRTKGADGKTIEVSLAEAGRGLTTQKHVHALTEENLSDLTITQAIERLKSADPQNFDRYCEAIGLKSDSSVEDIAKIAIEKGQFFGQTKKLDGWRAALPENLVTKTVQEQIGTKIVEVPGHYEVVPGKAVSDPVKPFGLGDAVVSVADKAKMGVAVDVVDALHEIAKPTHKVDEGSFEKNNPELETSKKSSAARDDRDDR